jgi:hypothetical protein
MWIQAPPAFQQSLTPQNFVNAGNTTTKIVGGIKKRCVGIGQLLR